MSDQPPTPVPAAAVEHKKEPKEPFVGSPQSVDDCPKITMYNVDFRPELHAMHQSITELRLWTEMKQDPGHAGFAYSSKDYIEKIAAHPLNVKRGHSGMTQAYCMRVMQCIAKNGWAEFMKVQQAKPAKLDPMKDAGLQGGVFISWSANS